LQFSAKAAIQTASMMFSILRRKVARWGNVAIVVTMVVVPQHDGVWAILLASAGLAMIAMIIGYLYLLSGENP
jgi:thiamine transporter ThiT